MSENRGPDHPNLGSRRDAMVRGYDSLGPWPHGESGAPDAGAGQAGGSLYLLNGAPYMRLANGVDVPVRLPPEPPLGAGAAWLHPTPGLDPNALVGPQAGKAGDLANLLSQISPDGALVLPVIQGGAQGTSPTLADALNACVSPDLIRAATPAAHPQDQGRR